MSSSQLIALCIFAWGVGSFFYKIANDNMHPVLVSTIATSIYILATPIFFLLFKVNFNYALKGVSFAALGAAAMCIGTLTYSFALQKGTAGVVVTSASLYPAVTIVLSCIFLNEGMNLKKIAGILFAFTGVYLLSKK